MMAAGEPGGPTAEAGTEAGPDWASFGVKAAEAVDEIAASYQLRGAQPGIAYGVVDGGRLAHAGGLGQRRLGAAPPDADTVFRIASMTKSFTASAVMALRDDGVLGLDDLAEEYVPELRGWPSATPDAPRVRIRHLLTMTAGFPTDDPWGDRQQGTPLAEFAEFLSGGVSFAWAPGTRFEYSNLGYAILGRVISAASGRPYADVVRDRLLDPLGLSRTGFEAAGFAPDELAAGYRHDGSGWSQISPDPYGAFAPMGGIFSCVRDLATWVAGLAGAYPPGEEDTGGPHPLRRATRREMQLSQVATGWGGPAPLPGGPARTVSYGFGLFVEEDPDWGRVVQHSGGYPGFGSNMRWHPATGTGVIVLGNGTYAPVTPVAARMLRAVLRTRADRADRAGRSASPRASGGRAVSTADRAVPLAPDGPWPETLAARVKVTQLLQSWDDAAAERLFSENVALDEPFPERQSKIRMIREHLGDLRDDTERPPEFDSPAHCRWWLAGNATVAGEGPAAGDGTAAGGGAAAGGDAAAGGGAAARERLVVQAELRLTPERPPRVQSLTLAVPPAAGSPLRLWLDRIVALLNDGAPEWPSSLPTAPSLDTALLTRRLRTAAAWAGRCRITGYRSGDGETSATVDLQGDSASLILVVIIVRPGGELHQADVALGS
jgi:CubicO group peptidase (beta-lactamase class C family)